MCSQTDAEVLNGAASDGVENYLQPYSSVGKPLADVTEEDMTEDKYVIRRHCIDTLADILAFKHCSMCRKNVVLKTRLLGERSLSFSVRNVYSTC
ncbi:hypothetical protein DPMN_064285 [Dreissena polymorpha]|uniref:Uncharacterized protein n=1 Tax=Dreissena polymorpha TaxID=45954 RepID=A0A9D4CC06_DREPO|nr:hypothetical protein DPMN_064285 [Dreissena polymorpha]